MVKKNKALLVVLLSLLISASALLTCACEKKCTEHSFGAWTVIKEATCTTAGEERRECENCGEAETHEIAGGHLFTNYVSNNDATCEADGTKTAYCDHGCGERDIITDEGTVLGHTYGEWVSNGDGTHTKTCANDSTHIVTESCHGGEATCAEQAICDDCKSEYGGVKHIIDDSGWCTICDQSISATKCVKYAASEDNTYASVVGYNGSSTRVRIADSYSGLPVIAINSSAFKGTAITEVIIPDSVASIGNDAFSGCPIETATIPALASSYVNNNKLKTVVITSGESIEEYAFYNCSNLTSVTIPSSVTSIGSVAFYNCSSLTNVTIPDSVISIGVGVFKGCSSLVSITIPSSVTIIEDDAFGGCISLSYNEYDNAYYLGNSDNPYVVLIKAKSTDITSCTINEKTKFIHSSTFKGCGSLTSITIPSSVTSIGESAFFNCSSLTNVTIGNGVTRIEKNAFYNCSSLSEVTIPFSVTSIGRGVFSTCYNLNYNEYDNAKYLGNNENPYVVLVEAKSESITSCTINENTKVICDSAFYECSNLTNITIPDSVTSIGDRAFYECSSLTSVSIGNSVTSIGSGVFYNCSRLSKVTIPDSATSIGNSAFYGCSSLTSVTIGNGITSMQNGLFGNCSRLSKVTIPDSVTSIEYGAFYNCGNLTSITIGNGVKSIVQDAFRSCSSLKDVYYKGSESEWNKISVNSGNDPLTSATRYYYSESNPFEGENAVEDGNYWHYDTDGKTILVWVKE